MNKSKIKEDNIFDGGVGEFFHVFEKSGAAIGLRIPIDQVKDIDSAIKKAKEAGFDAEVITSPDGNHNYLEIAKYGYNKDDDWNVVEELKKVAKEVSKEDYSDHIENLQLTLNINKKENLESPISKMKEEGILTSDENELLQRVLQVLQQGEAPLSLFASMHNNKLEGNHLENILNRLLEDGKKRVIVLFETISDPIIKELLNNPETDLEKIQKYYIPMFGFQEAAGNVVFALINVLHKYGTDRFEIVPIDLTSKEMGEFNALLSKEEYEKKRYENIVKNVLNLYSEKKDDNNTVFLVFTGADHVWEIYQALKKKGMDKNVCGYTAPGSL